jgi:hypothetical protein
MRRAEWTAYQGGCDLGTDFWGHPRTIVCGVLRHVAGPTQKPDVGRVIVERISISMMTFCRGPAAPLTRRRNWYLTTGSQRTCVPSGRVALPTAAG